VAGAAMVADLIEAVVASLEATGSADYVVHQMNAPRKETRFVDRQYDDSYAMWSLFPHSSDSREKSVWRVAEFLGLDRSTDGAAAAWKHVVEDDPDARVVVLDDAGLGFRSQRELWPKAIVTAGKRPWIVLKMARPVARGDLWEHLHRNHVERLIVVMTVNDLRLTEVQISRELSWERTAQDIRNRIATTYATFRSSWRGSATG
jgi:hypothetical protein